MYLIKWTSVIIYILFNLPCNNNQILLWDEIPIDFRSKEHGEIIMSALYELREEIGQQEVYANKIISMEETKPVFRRIICVVQKTEHHSIDFYSLLYKKENNDNKRFDYKVTSVFKIEGKENITIHDIKFTSIQQAFIIYLQKNYRKLNWINSIVQCQNDFIVQAEVNSSACVYIAHIVKQGTYRFIHFS